MDNKNYRARIADKLLAEKLDAMGAVLIEGAKWCGKTTTAEKAAKSVLYLADPDTFRQNMEMIPRALSEKRISPFRRAVRQHFSPSI